MSRVTRNSDNAGRRATGSAYALASLRDGPTGGTSAPDAAAATAPYRRRSTTRRAAGGGSARRLELRLGRVVLRLAAPVRREARFRPAGCRPRSSLASRRTGGAALSLVCCDRTSALTSDMREAISFWTALSKSSSFFLLSARPHGGEGRVNRSIKVRNRANLGGALPGPPKAAQHSSRMISFLRASAATLASKARSSPSCGAALVVGGAFCFCCCCCWRCAQSRARISSSSKDGAWPKWGLRGPNAMAYRFWAASQASEIIKRDPDPLTPRYKVPYRYLTAVLGGRDSRLCCLCRAYKHTRRTAAIARYQHLTSTTNCKGCESPCRTSSNHSTAAL